MASQDNNVENFAEFTEKLYEENKQLRDKLLKEKERLIEEKEKRIQELEERETQEYDKDAMPSQDHSEEEDDEDNEKNPSKIASKLNREQKKVLRSLESDFRPSKEVAEEVSLKRRKVQGMYPTFKEYELIETEVGTGIRLTNLGESVRNVIGGTEVEKKVEQEYSQRKLDVLCEFKEDEYISLSDVEPKFEFSRWKLRQAVEELRDEGLLESINGKGTILTDDGKSFLQEKGLVENSETVQDQESEGDLPEYLKNRYNNQKGSLKIERLDPEERSKLQEIYLLDEQTAKSVQKTAEELYGIQNPDTNDSRVNMVYRAFKKNEKISKMDAMGDRRQKVYFIDSDKEQMVDSYKGDEAVKLAKEKFDDYIDGDTKYAFIKKAFGKLAPAKGEKKEITFQNKRDAEGFVKYFTAENPNADTRAWTELCTSNVLQNALKEELGMQDATFKIKKTTGGNPVTNSILEVDRT